MKKIYYRHKDVLNYSNVDNIDYENFFKPYLCNNNLLEFLEVALDYFDYRKSLDYYELKTLYTLIHMSETSDENVYNMELSYNIKDILRYYIRFKKLLEITPIEDRKRVIKRILEDDYSNSNKCTLYYYDLNHYKIVNSVICDNEFLNIIKVKFINKDIPFCIIKK